MALPVYILSTWLNPKGKFRKLEEIRFCDYVVVVVVFPQRVVGQGPLIARALAHPRIHF